MDRTSIYWASVVIPKLTEDAAAQLIVNAGGAVQKPEARPYDLGETEWRVRLFEITTSGATREHAIKRWVTAATLKPRRCHSCPRCAERRRARRSKNLEAAKPAMSPQLAGGDAYPRSFS